jgi:hypothetical protein
MSTTQKAHVLCACVMLIVKYTYSNAQNNVNRLMQALLSGIRGQRRARSIIVHQNGYEIREKSVVIRRRRSHLRHQYAWVTRYASCDARPPSRPR